MSAGVIKRPLGTPDYLLMLFHDEAGVGTLSRGDKAYPANTMMIWPPGKAQYYGNETSPFRHSWIHCEGRGLREILSEVRLPILRPFPVDSPTLFQQGLSDLLTELSAYTQPDAKITKCLLELCLLRIAQARQPTRAATRVPEKLLAVQRMINSVPTEEVTLADMARMAGMSPPYFCAQFKKTFGVSPMESLIHHRLHHAAHLLTNWNLNISEIAAQVGYQDLFHFSKMFRKKFGVSPRKMRTQTSEKGKPPSGEGS
jgi:AraC-like DNA-binding protein